ncbi:DivIVA domain-containing protein [Galactobacter caseinivorans]|uniref:DivIVA domain-containing protein n=1 Tax=Galactobacter caseinivorans TaxID=2676123 RepID=A0A496PM17_9MICC|nr:DivIVA domain-containing protein [Galactobacter caseinivorans]RKW71588.1 DivIVA domain-containing protein [Galactobacter caseinivorans]
MQYIVLFIALAVVGALAVLLFRSGSKGSTQPLDATPPLLGLAEPDPVLPPVLLPQHPRAADVDAVRLSPALRGYRCDQVDAVLDALGAELDSLGAEVERLKALLPPGAHGTDVTQESNESDLEGRARDGQHSL